MTEQELRDLMRTRNRDVTLDNFADYAKEILSMQHKEYAEHLHSIVTGTVPFGYKVADE